MTHPVELQQEEGFRFAIRFGPDMPLVHSDEPPPLGGGSGPSPEQMLTAAVANCLSASLVFALRKFKQSPGPIRTTAEAQVGRNAENRLRVQSIGVRITLGVPAATLESLDRALSQFEAFCTVTQSVRAAIPVEVEVYDSAGARLK